MAMGGLIEQPIKAPNTCLSSEQLKVKRNWIELSPILDEDPLI